jgi:hypothetical protein
MYLPLERREAPCDRIWRSPLCVDLKMIIAVDNTQALRTFRLNPTNEHHLPQRDLSAVVFFMIATIFDIWLVRKHELSFCPFKHFRWLFSLCIDHLSDETKNFRWLMSTLVARLNHRILLFCQFLDRTKTNMTFGIILEKQTLKN